MSFANARGRNFGDSTTGVATKLTYARRLVLLEGYETLHSPGTLGEQRPVLYVAMQVWHCVINIVVFIFIDRSTTNWNLHFLNRCLNGLPIQNS